MQQSFVDIVNQDRYPFSDAAFRAQCRAELELSGALVMPDFLRPEAIQSVQMEGEQHQAKAYYTANDHNIFLKDTDHEFTIDHVRNRRVTSSKGCIATDQMPGNSALRVLYDSSMFQDFLCSVLSVSALYEYADTLSSINLHFASEGQELGWHFDNSSFAITLMIQSAEEGGEFEYVKDVRDVQSDEMHFDACTKVLDGETVPQRLSINPGALVLFRGHNSMHRVTPTRGTRTRMLAVLAYNTVPNIALSESARMTFFGRLR